MDSSTLNLHRSSICGTVGKSENGFEEVMVRERYLSKSTTFTMFYITIIILQYCFMISKYIIYFIYTFIHNIYIIFC